MATDKRKPLHEQVSIVVSNVESKVSRTVDIRGKEATLSLDTEDSEGLKLLDGLRATNTMKELIRWKREHAEALGRLPEEVRLAVQHHMERRQHRFFYPE